MKEQIEVVITAEENKISNKIRYAKIREDIKKYSALQPDLKNQRKTVRIVGKRTQPAWAATESIVANKFILRHLYRAYNILKGIIPSKISKCDINKSLVSEYVTKYTFKEVVSK